MRPAPGSRWEIGAAGKACAAASLLAFGGSGSAQERTTTTAPPAALTLLEAIERAADRSEEVQLARATLEATQQEVISTRSEALPQLDFTSSYVRTFRSTFDVLSSGVAGESPLGDLPFGQEHAYAATLNASQLLFAGGRVYAQITSAKHAREAAELDLREQTAEVALQVRTAYYRALLATELEASAAAALAQASDFLRQEQQRFRAGYAADLDVLRAEVSYENLHPQLVEARNSSQLTQLELKRLVNVPLESALRLSTRLVPPPESPPHRRLDAETLLARRASVRAAERVAAAREAEINAAQSAYFPTVSLQTSYGRQAFPSDALNFSGTGWEPDWTATLAFQWPLFTGFRRGAQVAQSRIRLREARLQLAQLRESVQLEYEQALGEKDRAYATIAARRRTVEQAQRVYELTVLRYQKGQSTQLEISDSRVELLQARTNLAQALTDFYIADAQVLRATTESTAESP